MSLFLHFQFLLVLSVLISFPLLSMLLVHAFINLMRGNKIQKRTNKGTSSSEAARRKQEPVTSLILEEIIV